MDTVCRPFAIRAKTLRKIGGFDFDYRPTMFDDIDISLRLFAAGFWNIYIPFDVVNLVASVKTMVIPLSEFDHYSRQLLTSHSQSVEAGVVRPLVWD